MKTSQSNLGERPAEHRVLPDPNGDGSCKRTLPIGAEVLESGGVHFRVWAPRSTSVAVHWVRDPRALAVGQENVELEPEPDGYFSGYVPDAKPDQLYKFQLDSGAFPDPASRFQPEGPHGPSQIIDPRAFKWTDANWQGVSREGQVIYEMHFGTFTREGTWRAAMGQLPELAELGITVIELMPVADFPGNFGWGYDGVNLFAPTRLYGQPDDFRAFVNRAHTLGLGVILDVVYNHVGPDGNYLKEFSRDYFTDRHENEWGEAINFDGANSSPAPPDVATDSLSPPERGEGRGEGISAGKEIDLLTPTLSSFGGEEGEKLSAVSRCANCGPVRELFISNAGYWIDEYHLDGLRLDATQQIFDSSPDHIVAAIVRRVREAAKGRATYITAENERQHTRLVRDSNQGGYGVDALWNDDFHHSAIVAVTGRKEAYYSDYNGSPQEFISALKRGYLYQGQWYSWQQKKRGTPALDLHPACFVDFIQNHDQIANSLRGLRLHQLTSPGRYKAMTALLLLGPGTPLLFQGQEFAASAPFLYFADHHPELAKLVASGRRKFMEQFPSATGVEAKTFFCDPETEAAFLRCKLDFAERVKHAGYYQLHRDLLKLRGEDPVFGRPRIGGMDGAVLGAEAFVLRFFGEQGDDRLLLVNFGMGLHLGSAPEPLLAPVEGCAWKVKWSSEDPSYGGDGMPPLEVGGAWRIPGHAAMVLSPDRKS